MKKSIAIITILAVMAFSFAGCTADGTTTASTTKSAPAATTTKATTVAQTTAVPTTKATTTQAKLGIGSTVDVSPFSFTITSVQVVKVDNQFATVKNAIKIAVTIANTSKETADIMMLQHPVFLPNGTETDTLTTGMYFKDALSASTSIRAGKTLDGFLYAAYVEDGEHVMELKYLLGDPVEIYFDVKK